MVSALLAATFLNLTPVLITPAHAAACSVTTGTVNGVKRYAIFDAGTSCTWVVPTGVTSINYLAVGGGGGGGGGRSTSASFPFGGGGGGAGGVVQASSFLISAGTTITITIGTGGGGGAAGVNGTSGNATSFIYNSTTITASGGAGGNGANINTNDQANLSGDGGANASYLGGASDWDGGGGGAGSAGAGSNGIDIGGQGATGGAGGAGTLNTLLNTNLYYGGGGGGGGTPHTNTSETDGYGGTGGSSVGGNGGGGPGILPTAGAANTGSGGGGGAWRSSSADSLRAGAAGSDGRIVFTFDKNQASISTISLTSSSGSDNTYSIGNAINVTITANEAITVTGTPRIPVLGLSGKYFTYSSGTGTASLVFSYTVALNDSASAGVGVTANTLELNSGTLNDGAGIALVLTHSAITQSLSHKVDGIRPTVTFTSSNNVNENQSATALLTLSEPGTITLSSSWDRSHVTFDTSTNTVTFTPHDFENPQDADLNNVYYVSFTIADANGNSGSGTYNLFFTVVNVAEYASVGTPSLSASPVKGVAVTITVTASVAGKVDFFWNGKRIAGCLGKSTTGTSPNITATCLWKPPVMNAITLSATIKPTDSNYLASKSGNLSILPLRRSTTR